LIYLLRHPSALGVSFAHPLALALLLLLAVFLRYQLHPTAPWVNRLRAVAFACVIATIAGMHLTVRLPDTHLSLVAAVDLSASVGAQVDDWAQRYLSATARALAPGDEMAVLTFAGDVVVVAPPGKPGSPRPLTEPASRTATDIAQAIDAAVALLPDEGDRRILLLTDGNQTKGDAERHLARLRADGTRVDAAVPPAGDGADISLDKLVVPAVVAESSVVPLRIVARNGGGECPAVLNLFLDGEIMNSAPVSLPAGLTTLEVPYRTTGRGGHRLRVELAVHGDPLPQNNQREVAITVTEKARVLLLTPRRRSLLAEVLGRHNIVVHMKAPRDAPKRIDNLREYHGVLLEDTTGAELENVQLDVLERYVREFGGGLVVVGGPRTFGDVRFARTALRSVLPVTLEPRRPIPRSREPLALVILIDRSNSMGYNSVIRTLHDGEKLRYAKEAALAVFHQLRDSDLVGVTVFDSRHHVIAPLALLRENRQRLETDIPRVIESGGTDFYDALEAAGAELAEARVSRRHVILLTDGDTNRAAADHYPLIADLAEAGISVTTIRIGEDDVNLRLLRDISGQTGGEFYHVHDVTMLPELMLRDTTRALGSKASNEQFLPEVGQASEILLGIARTGIPPLGGYAYARARPGAEVVLHVARLDRRDPLLAVWQYGLGRAAAFTASTVDDAERWPGWTEFSRFWSQLVRWTIPNLRMWDYAVEIHRHHGISELKIRTFDPACSDTVVRAGIQVTPDDMREIGLTPSGPHVFSGQLPDVPAGPYPVTVVRRHSDGTVTEDTQTAVVPQDEDDPQEEYRTRGPDLALLTRLTEGTGGSLNPKPGDLGRRRPGARRKYYPLDRFLLPLAMLSFLGDIAIRRLGTARTQPPTQIEPPRSAERQSKSELGMV
jgi:Ca-activated chloride channel homolog